MRESLQWNWNSSTLFWKAWYLRHKFKIQSTSLPDRCTVRHGLGIHLSSTYRISDHRIHRHSARWFDSWIDFGTRWYCYTHESLFNHDWGVNEARWKFLTQFSLNDYIDKLTLQFQTKFISVLLVPTVYTTRLLFSLEHEMCPSRLCVYKNFLSMFSNIRIIFFTVKRKFIRKTVSKFWNFRGNTTNNIFLLQQWYKNIKQILLLNTAPRM